MNPRGRSALGSDVSVVQCLCKALRSTIEDCDKIQYFSGKKPLFVLSILLHTRRLSTILVLISFYLSFCASYIIALAICNALSVYFKSKGIEDMVALGIVKDLAVIMMLRVNDVIILISACCPSYETQQARALLSTSHVFFARSHKHTHMYNPLLYPSITHITQKQ